MGSFRSPKIWNWWKDLDNLAKLVFLFYMIPVVFIFWHLIDYWHSNPFSFIGFFLFTLVLILTFKSLKKKFAKPYWKTEAFEKLSEQEISKYWRTPEGLAEIKKEREYEAKFTFWSNFIIYIILAGLILLGLFGLIKLIKYFWYF
jgi:hypothetical protein